MHACNLDVATCFTKFSQYAQCHLSTGNLSRDLSSKKIIKFTLILTLLNHVYIAKFI